MWHRLSNTRFIALIIILSLSMATAGGLLAQDGDTPVDTPTPTLTQTPTPTATPTEVPVNIVVSGIQPTEFVQGGGTLTITGENFTSNTTALLDGTVMLPVITQSSNSLEVSVGGDVPPGLYTVAVSDPVGGTAMAASSLSITAPTDTPTPVPQLTVTQSEPTQVTAGQNGTLSILGTNFGANTTVRLVGYGFLQTNFVNSGALTATLPANIPASQYTIEVSDPTYGTATAPNTLTVVQTATATAVPTATSIPGQPTLIIRGFSASPSSIYPGDSTLLTFETVNVGTRTAQGVVVSLGNSDFAPANGQASLTLPDLVSYASYTVTLAVIAPTNASEGPANIPLVMSSHDFSGQTYTDSATLSVNILSEQPLESQVVLDSYQVTPNTALPGETVHVQALFMNTGTETASQVLVQLDTNNAVLIAGSEGNSFPIGDMLPGESAAVVMPLVVANNTSSGIQAQSFTISYLQNGGSGQSSASISLNIEQVIDESPRLLLVAYNTGQDGSLQPGQQFTFTVTVENAGAADASDLLIGFGQSTTSSGEGVSSSSSSDNFAPLNSGGTVLVGDLPAGETTTVSQDFIVNNDVSSGVYALSLALQYQLDDGTTIEDTLNASLIVKVLPRLRLTLADPLDDPVMVGESYDATLDIANLGTSDVELTQIHMTGDNLTITEGAETLLETLQSDDDTSVSFSLEPVAAGVYTLVAELDYLDEFNQTQTYTVEFSGTVEEAAQPQIPMREFTPPAQTTQNDDVLGRLLLGFLGLGG
jgi:hypothetical protein